MTIILSKLAKPMEFCIYEKNEKNDLKPNRLIKKIRIDGGADVLNKRLLSTPQGITTTIDDDDFNLLSGLAQFNRMKKKGYITVIKSKNESTIEKAAKDMNKDKAAQMTNEDIKSHFRPDKEIE